MMTSAVRVNAEDWIRSPVDVPLARKAVSAARRALVSEDRDASPREVVFWLMREAARTERAIKGPGPRGHVSCMPEVYHTNGEIFATEVAMIQDKISYPPTVKVVVTAGAASRYLEVTKWLRFVQGINRAKSKELLWLIASGVTLTAVARRLGYPSNEAVRAAKHRRLGDIVNRLNKEEVFD